jgi:uncharacterized coiled-coil DUF342 family protein
MKLELNRLIRLAGCGALLCGSLVLAEDAKPAAPAAQRREMSQEAKDLRAKIETLEKAALEKDAALKAAVDALDAQIKAKRAEGTPEARTQAREISKQRQEKFVAVQPELKDLYAKQNEMRQQGGGRGQAGVAKPAPAPAAK